MSNQTFDVVMKMKVNILLLAVVTLALTGCTSAFYGASSASDDLYAMHNRTEIARRQQAEAEARKAEAEARKAELEARTKVSDSEVLYAAKEKARQIIAQAEDRSRKLYQVANEYAEDALARTEEAVQAALDEVKESRMRFRNASAAKMQEQRAQLEEKSARDDEEV